MKKKVYSFLFTFLCFVVIAPSMVLAQTKVFTLEELKQFDGKNGNKAYYAYEGKVYDVTGSKLWQEGEHFGLHAGEDLTGKMEGAPHGTEVFAGFEVVGTYPTENIPAPSEPEEPVVIKKEIASPVMMEDKVWYEGRIKIVGLSILAWTGILLGIFFVLTFATCFAMPWAKSPLPGEITPEVIHASFDLIVDTSDGKSGKKPSRVRKIQFTFIGREQEKIYLQDFAEKFKDTTNPKKNASNAISSINKSFKDLRIGLEIHSEPVGDTYCYYFRRVGV